MKYVLVTGGAGYIGSHTCKWLARHGFTPVVLDNLSRGHREFVRWGPLEIGDVLDAARVLEVVQAYKPIAAIHFAAFAYVGESFESPTTYYRLNVGGLANLLDALKSVGAPPIVFSSSCATYGIPARVPIKEGDPQVPISPYGSSKLFAESLLRDAGNAHGIRWIALRYFNASGGDPDLEVGEWHYPETHLLPRTIGAALGIMPPIEIYGVDHPTPDGSPVRDYVHVEDLAKAHVAAVKRLLGGIESHAVNLGTGVGSSVQDVIAAVERATGRVVPRVMLSRRLGDPPIAVADGTRARAELDWSPSFELDAIVESALRWHRHMPDSLKP